MHVITFGISLTTIGPPPALSPLHAIQVRLHVHSDTNIQCLMLKGNTLQGPPCLMN
jgi:hypothetical protein